MKAKFEFLNYLDSHLKFGCIERVDYHFIGDKSLHVKIFPLKKFFNNDLNFIHYHCLENDEIKSFPYVKLKFLDLTDTFISAVYKFS